MANSMRYTVVDLLKSDGTLIPDRRGHIYNDGRVGIEMEDGTWVWFTMPKPLGRWEWMFD